MTLFDPVPPAGSEPPEEAPAPAPTEAEPHQSSTTPNRRTRYGRRRGPVPVGDAFVPRLGPAGEEPFAALDDPEDGELALARPSHNVPIDTLRFVAVDCETTGQSPHRMVEIGAVAFTLDRHLMSFETLVHSTDRINPFARRIHGISSETLGGAPPARAVLRRFQRFVRGAVLIEHSADAFDTRLIARTLGEDLDADNIDTSRLAGKLWELKDTIGLERLCSELGVTHRRPHHALADAEATMGCFVELVRRGRDLFGWRTLGDLLADGQPPPPRMTPPPRRGPAGGDDTAPRRRRRGGRRRSRSSPAASNGETPPPPPDASGV